jgi:feruloyl esterase
MKFEQSAWAAVLSASLAIASPSEPQPSSCSTDTTPNDFNSTCASLASRLEVENGSIYFSEFVAAGTNLSLPDNNATCAQPYMLVTADICRVAVYVATSNQSGVNMEAWLPSNWTGRYLSLGKALFAQTILLIRK